MTKLSDTQSIILSKASQHEALLAVAPSNLPTAARQAVFRSTLRNLLLEEVPAPVEHRDLEWRQDDEGAWIALRVTARGQAVHDDLRPKGRAQQERILVPFAPEERPLFLDMLTRLVEAHEAYARPGNGRRRLTRPAASDASSNAAAAD
jgi:hypothetical protein